MSIKSAVLALIFLYSFLIFGQEEKARRVTEVLCSDSLYGRGYVNNGVNKAADFLKNEFQKAGLKPFFGDTSYYQSFTLDVNTFPRIIEVKRGGETLRPGIDFLIDETSGSFVGQLDLIAIDMNILNKRDVI